MLRGRQSKLATDLPRRIAAAGVRISRDLGHSASGRRAEVPYPVHALSNDNIDPEPDRLLCRAAVEASSRTTVVCVAVRTSMPVMG